MPAATKKVPPYCTELRVEAMSMMYPTIATTQPTSMSGPRICHLSDSHPMNRTVKKALIFGGTVKSWAVTLAYPSDLMIVGRKSEKE